MYGLWKSMTKYGQERNIQGCWTLALTSGSLNMVTSCGSSSGHVSSEFLNKVISCGSGNQGEQN